MRLEIEIPDEYTAMVRESADNVADEHGDGLGVLAFAALAAWPEPAKCGHVSVVWYTNHQCDLDEGHDGPHSETHESGAVMTWPRVEVRVWPESVPVPQVEDIAWEFKDGEPVEAVIQCGGSHPRVDGIECDRPADHDGMCSGLAPRRADQMALRTNWERPAADVVWCGAILQDGDRDVQCGLPDGHEGQHRSRYGLQYWGDPDGE